MDELVFENIITACPMNQKNIRITNFDWRDIKLVVFDMDGTLYDQKKLRRKMFYELIKFVISHPFRFKEIFILKTFREAREKHTEENSGNLESKQYTWGQEKMNVSMSITASIVNYWMMSAPLKYLPECRFDYVNELFSRLSDLKILTAVFSDYPVKEKMKTLGLKANLEICSADTNIDRFKPDPKGLFRACPHDCNIFWQKQMQYIIDGVYYSRFRKNTKKHQL